MEMLYQMAFAAMPGMGVDIAKQLLDIIGDEKQFFLMKEGELAQLLGPTNRWCSKTTRDKILRKAQKELDFIANKKITPIYYTSPQFPKRLLEANDAPIILYTTGDCDLNAKRVVSMVGTRNATPAGIKFCDNFVKDLSALIPNVLIVSGLAYGIDIASHRAAINHGAPTVAVMARGLNHIYPAVHRRDAVNIVNHGGALVTDYMSQDELHKGNFLARNRIIAALADVTIVVESASHGGSLVTASIAMGYNRDVMAVPGRVTDEMSKGCNKLIAANRAALLTNAQQLIDTMMWDVEAQPTMPRQLNLFNELNDTEREVVNVLRQSAEPVYANDIARVLQRPAYLVTSTLVELDFKGIIVTLPGSRYQLA